MSVVETSQHPGQLLLAEWSAQLKTRSGLRLNVRPAAPEDEAQLIEFFTHVAAEDLRFRFLSAVPKVGPALVRELLQFDHSRTDHFLAFDARDDGLVATAMIAADPELDRAEVAIAIRSDSKHHGIGWTLLHYLADYAASRGFKRLESIECGENHEAIELEREMGFTVTRCPEDPTLVVVAKDLAPRKGR